jgi:single-strand DNA-binding protein
LKNLNRFQFLGNLGADVETRFTGTGIAVSNLKIAVNDRIKKGEQWQDEVDWFQVTLWRNEGILNYLTKGSKVYVEGRIKPRSYEDKDGNKKYVTDFVVEEIHLLGSSNGNASGSSKPNSKPAAGNSVPDDDVPF